MSPINSIKSELTQQTLPITSVQYQHFVPQARKNVYTTSLRYAWKYWSLIVLFSESRDAAGGITLRAEGSESHPPSKVVGLQGEVVENGRRLVPLRPVIALSSRPSP